MISFVISAVIFLHPMSAAGGGQCSTNKQYGIVHCWEYIGNGDFQPHDYVPTSEADYPVNAINVPYAWPYYKTERSP